MYMIKLEKTMPGLDDLYVTTVTAKTLKGIGVFEAACIPLQEKIKKFKTEEEAKRVLRKFGYIDEEGNPSQELKRARVTRVKVIEDIARDLKEIRETA